MTDPRDKSPNPAPDEPARDVPPKRPEEDPGDVPEPLEGDDVSLPV